LHDMRLGMLRPDKSQIDAGPEKGSATRRGFLLGLLGGLASAVGLTAAAAKSEESSPDETPPSPGRPVANPIDNIFVPLRTTTRKPD